MGLKELLAWQWAGYSRNHVTRSNLLLHVGAVPLFLVGNVTALVGLIRLAPWPIGLGVAAMGLSLALQGRGHKREPETPEPFTSPANAVARLVLEQWVTFPRFVLSGAWRRALQGGG